MNDTPVKLKKLNAMPTEMQLKKKKKNPTLGFGGKVWQRLKALKIKSGEKNKCMRPTKKEKSMNVESPSASPLTILVTLGTRCLQLLCSPLHH